MAFTEAQLLADLANDGPTIITRFDKGSTTTDVYVENYNQTARKAGWTQILNTRTAAQAHSDIEASLG